LFEGFSLRPGWSVFQKKPSSNFTFKPSNLYFNLSEIILTIEGIDPVELYGEQDVKLNLLRKAFPDISITARGNNLKLSGEKKFTQAAKGKFEQMVRLLKERKQLPVQMVEELLLNGSNPFNAHISEAATKVLVHGPDGKVIRVKTQNQRKLVEASEANDVVFAVGPAGTGKTYTAVALAVRALKNRIVKKIILTRPAVEAGESLGYLPGDLKEKIDPYLRPLYDALDDMIPAEKLKYFMETRVIEIAPLAYMRGRTLDNAFIILDEAQNTSSLQIKMFLTRLGPSAKAILTGDLSQVDLPMNTRSGLRKAIEILGNIDGIATVRLTAEDVVRHRLVKEVIRAYEKDGERQQRSWEESHGQLPSSHRKEEPARLEEEE
jgi:phosphate starvation-inducible protein PhoH and related proteins